MEKFEAFSSEAWVYAGEMTLLGMGMVFAVLAILWLFLAIFKLVFVPKSKKEAKPIETKPVVQEKSTAPAENTNTANITVNANDDATIAAVITAAVAAYMAEAGVPEGGFRVVSFKRAGSTHSWNKK